MPDKFAIALLSCSLRPGRARRKRGVASGLANTGAVAWFGRVDLPVTHLPVRSRSAASATCACTAIGTIVRIRGARCPLPRWGSASPRGRRIRARGNSEREGSSLGEGEGRGRSLTQACGDRTSFQLSESTGKCGSRSAKPVPVGGGFSCYYEKNMGILLSLLANGVC